MKRLGWSRDLLSSSTAAAASLSGSLAFSTQPWLGPPARCNGLRNTDGPGVFLRRSASKTHSLDRTKQRRPQSQSPTGSLQAMPRRLQSTAASSQRDGTKRRSPPELPRPSSSLLLLSPTNELLLLHRVHTSSSFASAHVFPGGNLDPFQDGDLPLPGSQDRHLDGPAYRLAAIRETFEESGILLARGPSGLLLDLPEQVREAGRKAVHGSQVRFGEWLESLGGSPDVDGLVPFTRWITPANLPKRYTTQMYLYFLPLSAPAAAGAPHREAVVPTPTHDGGVEHTAATFGSVAAWLGRARRGEIVLFPPQLYLLTLLSGPLSGSGASDPGAQRAALREFLARTPTGSEERPAAGVPWADKVMCPTLLFSRRADGRSVLGLDKAGAELQGSGRGGDWDRVVLVRYWKGVPREVEVRWREEVLAEERGADREEGGGESTRGRPGKL